MLSYATKKINMFYLYVTGLLIYAFYGLKNSIEGVKDQTTKTEEGKSEQKISN